MVKELPLASAPSSAANGGAGGAMVINRGSEECRGNTGSTHTNIAVLVADLNDQTIYTELQKNDVLLGRGTGPNDFEGNVRFRKTIKDVLKSVVDLNELSNKKTALARLVVDQVARRGGRFLRKLSKEETSVALKRMFKDEGTRRPAGFLTRNRGGRDLYVEVSKSVAVEKTKQSIRHQRRMAAQWQQVRGGRACFQTKGSFIGGTTARIMLRTTNSNTNNKKAAGGSSTTSRPSTPAASSCTMLGDNASPPSGATFSTIPSRVNRSSDQHGVRVATILLSAAAAVDARGECGASDGVGPKGITTIDGEEEDTTNGGQATSGSATASLTTTNGARNEEDQHPPLPPATSHELLLLSQEHHDSLMMPPPPTVPPASLPFRASFFLNPSTSSRYYSPACCVNDAACSTDSLLPFTASAALMRRRAGLASSSSCAAAMNFVASGEPALIARTAAIFAEHSASTTTALQQLLRSSSVFLSPAARAAIFPSPSFLGRTDSLIYYPRPTPSSAVPPGVGYGSLTAGTGEASGFIVELPFVLRRY